MAHAALSLQPFLHIHQKPGDKSLSGSQKLPQPLPPGSILSPSQAEFSWSHSLISMQLRASRTLIPSRFWTEDGNQVDAHPYLPASIS